MSDKGFNVQDIFAPYDVTVNIPTFFRKQNRMQEETVTKDRKVASKSAHREIYWPCKNVQNIEASDEFIRNTFVI